ncbi:MAG: glycyl-radical enzyme activating protein [Oscillospiraceae bacterium]
MQQQGTVFNIQRYTIHDGPGLRTEFFLKGCPMHCEWCSNPESQSSRIELGVYTAKCLSLEKCGACRDACPSEGALQFSEGKLIAIDHTKCSNCFACYEECPSDAIKQWGRRMTIEDCMKEIRKDKGYFERSGGGVTISGGDPLVQCDFVAALLKACRAEGFHTCFESDFYSDWSAVATVLPYTDLFIADLKHMDTEIHKERTGVHNELILENLKKLAQTGTEIICRIPIIPGFNDTMENMEASADFILHEMGGNIRTLQLLSFMRLGEEKYASLGLAYPMAHLQVDRKSLQSRVEDFAEYFSHRGIHCLVGTKEKE